MRKRIYYTDLEILEVEDIGVDDSQVARHISSSVYVMVAEEKQAVKALTTLGINCDRLSRAEVPLNHIEAPISSHPFKPELSRKVVYAGVFEFPTLNAFDIHYTVKHYDADGNYVPELEQDALIIVPAPHDVPYADTGLSRYEYFVGVVKGFPDLGIAPMPIYEAATAQVAVLDYWGDFNAYIEGWTPPAE